MFVGSPRVEGDEDEDEADDLDKEFSFNNPNWHESSDAKITAHSGQGYGFFSMSGVATSSLWQPGSSINPDVPLLTYGEEVCFQSLDIFLAYVGFPFPSHVNTSCFCLG